MIRGQRGFSDQAPTLCMSSAKEGNAAFWYVADVAFALRDLFETGVDLSHPSFHAFIHGYSQHASLDEELIAHMPTWMRVVNLIMYAKMVRAMDLAEEQGYPEAYAPLLLKLENKRESYKASLLSL